MVYEITPLVVLFVGAAVIAAGGRFARRIGQPEAVGFAVTLCIVAIVIALSPATWRALGAGGIEGDRLLTYARLVGFTGLMFISGNNFTAQPVHKHQIVSFGLFGALFVTVISLFLVLLVKQSMVVSALIAATTVASSLWFQSQLESDRRTDQTRPISFSVAVGLTGAALLGFYLANVVSGLSSTRRTVSTVLIVVLYELMKVAVVFAFAYFISSRFLSRAEGRVSAIRTNIAFILISVLLYALIAFAVGSLGGVAWAFFAGALWRQTNAGKEFSKRSKPFASALLVSLVFLSLTLQSHGRQFAFSVVVLLTAAVAIALKSVFTFFMLKRDATTKEQMFTALPAIVFPGEMGILFLSFSVAQSFVDGPVFFAILVYSFASSFAIPVLYRVAMGKTTASKTVNKVAQPQVKAVF